MQGSVNNELSQLANIRSKLLHTVAEIDRLQHRPDGDDQESLADAASDALMPTASSSAVGNDSYVASTPGGSGLRRAQPISSRNSASFAVPSSSTPTAHGAHGGSRSAGGAEPSAVITPHGGHVLADDFAAGAPGTPSSMRISSTIAAFQANSSRHMFRASGDGSVGLLGLAGVGASGGVGGSGRLAVGPDGVPHGHPHGHHALLRVSKEDLLAMWEDAEEAYKLDEEVCVCVCVRWGKTCLGGGGVRSCLD